MKQKNKPFLSSRQIAEIQARYASAPLDRFGRVVVGFSQALAQQYGVTKSRISQIGREGWPVHGERI